MKKVIVIGGGPAGLMAAYQSVRQGNQVLLIEKNKQLGKKLLMTGHGRCNVTNHCDAQTFLTKVNTNPKFLYSAMHSFSSQDMIDFLNENHCPTKEEDNHRMFPTTDSSYTVLNTFIQLLKDVDIHYEEKAVSLIVEEDICKGIKTNKGTYQADTVILCTGGKSYPLTGSTGDGYSMVNSWHKIVECKPALVALTCEETWIQELQGLSLSNIECFYPKKKKCRGDILFTHFGISGPMILNISSQLDNTVIRLDLFPDYSQEELNQKVLDIFSKYQNKQIQNTLSLLLPNKLVKPLLNHLEIPCDVEVNKIKKEQRKKIVYFLKNMELHINGNRGFKEAMVTKGGISVKEINPNTMESKKIKGLKFAGEIIDVDAMTGGYNLQIAWSTGYVAGKENE